MRARPATPVDAEAIACIYNQGIEERVATFETRPRSAEEIQGWFSGAYPTVVVVEDGGSSRSPAPPATGHGSATKVLPSSRSTSRGRLAAGERAGWRWRP